MITLKTLKEIDFTTCKLIFPYGTITEEGVKQLLATYTEDFTIANFYPDREVGCNRISFAVVDIPLKVMQKLANDSKVKEIDPMTSYSKKPSNAECCGGGGHLG